MLSIYEGDVVWSCDGMFYHLAVCCVDVFVKGEVVTYGYGVYNGLYL